MIENSEAIKASNHTAPGESTRQLLLDSAEHLFAEKGFADTSVRDITAKAGCNLAAVNYHFGGKENLYVSVFQRVLAKLCERRISGLRTSAAQGDLGLEGILRAFATAFLEPLVDTSRGRLMMLLFMREMARPRLPKGIMFHELIDPVSSELREALQKQCPGLSQDSAELCIHSLVGQLLHVIQAGRMLATAGRIDAPILDPSKAVEHIVKFSVAGVRRCAEEEYK